MVVYWRNQAKFDIALAALASVALWNLPHLGFPIIFFVDEQAVVVSARTWLGPVLTLLGMMSATTAFLFTVIDRVEFNVLRKSASESQLWRTVAENLFWLATSAVMAAGLTFWNGNYSGVAYAVSTFLVAIVSICIAKFIWIMTQIISVRIAQASTRASSGGRLR